MTQHNLKIWQRHFEDVLSGKKKAEHRVDDRNFQVGDTLCLEEVTEPELIYTGRKLYVYVTHIISNGEMAILSIEPMDTVAKPVMTQKFEGLYEIREWLASFEKGKMSYHPEIIAKIMLDKMDKSLSLLKELQEEMKPKAVDNCDCDTYQRSDGSLYVIHRCESSVRKEEIERQKQ